MKTVPLMIECIVDTDVDGALKELSNIESQAGGLRALMEKVKELNKVPILHDA